MNRNNFFEFHEDFFGARTFVGSAGDGTGWLIVDTSSAGTPTYAVVDGSECGEVKIDFDNTSEIQNVCLAMNDKLQFDIDRIVEFGWRVKMNQAALNATSSLAFGMTGDRNDAIDSIAQAMLFRVIGGTSTTLVVVESDDGTTDNDDVATGKTLINAYKWFTVSLACGKSDVRYFIDGQPVAQSTTFSMAAYSGQLQPFLQLQKTADTNIDGVTVDAFYCRGRRQP